MFFSWCAIILNNLQSSELQTMEHIHAFTISWAENQILYT